jgi:hypothetical protein
MWPTPTTAEAGKISCCPNYGQLGLSNHPDVHGYQVSRLKLEKSRSGQVVQNNHNTDGNRPESWRTPSVAEEKNQAHSQQIYLQNQVGATPKSKETNGKLNPRWVETLMGLPVGWTMPSCQSPVTIVPTNFDSSVTESSQIPQPELF